ncbi:dehydrogenase/reductase SDR family member 11-like [Patiria miniata]|uniref:Dehydrogenase/reductase SDR family member 11 n=1 Tax=Patiria miniata TaxID=46514 RepID=A0A914ABK0_PATMI|nr:dehydrogenase/reductase SDR family member 11-like [Patiria miniata]XP_038060831.1 dehydrogenase/reductase SDR family member 11-like [Patiria miniata]XP_038060832.1 dehydrogenase/reductase SDR family member 11-like [Patiria miniata]
MASIGGGMQRWAGRVALVTGASAGIGQSTARALVRHGMKVIGCARNIKTIEEDAKVLSGDTSVTGSLHAIKCDLTKEEEILAMFAEIKEKFGGVDVCVSNAGINHADSMTSPMGILNGETAKLRDMFEVNVLAVAICCREAVKQMEEKGATDGQLLVTNSLSGHRLTTKDTYFYAVTKHAVTALVEAIRRELREKKNHIRIAQISPGIVETEFRERMYPGDNRDKARKLYKTMEPLLADDITDSMLYVLGAPTHVQVHDILIRPTEQKF